MTIFRPTLLPQFRSSEAESPAIEPIDRTSVKARVEAVLAAMKKAQGVEPPAAPTNPGAAAILAAYEKYGTANGQ